MYHCNEFSNSGLGNYFGKSARECGLTIDTNVALYGKQDDRPKIVSSETIAGTSIAALDEFEHHLYGVDLNRRSKADFIVVGAVVINKDSFFLPIPVNFTSLRWMKFRRT